ncbi:hypothetical protein [Gemmobacter denitrificans]|uniref:Uncharacterized protein n=1 Tax=Gemmobacter denitrificans TaxID=3123040 RepID=A0ABU8BRR7_9RHOB
MLRRPALALMTAALMLAAPAGQAETRKSYKVETLLGKARLKNVPCQLIVGGVTTELRSPGSFKLPSVKGGVPPIDILSCRYKDQTLTTPTLADPRSVKVTFDFEPKEQGRLVGQIRFTKENGGLAAFFTAAGRLVLVD